MLDKHERNINYMRISLTDRCNLRCRYCMPETGVDNLSHYSILSLEEMARLVRIASELGIQKIRLTGGEPLVRRNVPQLISYIAQIPSIDDIALTTNGTLFAALADELKTAGLNRINFSLDSLVPEKFKYITRRGDLSKVKEAIFKALELDMHPVKINMVVIRGFNDDEIIDFVELAENILCMYALSNLCPWVTCCSGKKERMMPTQDIKAYIEENYVLTPQKSILGNGRQVLQPGRRRRVTRFYQSYEQPFLWRVQSHPLDG